MTRDATVLSDDECERVLETIRTVCQQQGHEILTLAVEPTHTHVLLAPVDQPVESVAARFKRQTTMVVRREREQKGGFLPQALWSRGRFVVYVYDPQHLENTMTYIERHAGAKKLEIEG